MQLGLLSSSVFSWAVCLVERQILFGGLVKVIQISWWLTCQVGQDLHEPKQQFTSAVGEFSSAASCSAILCKVLLGLPCIHNLGCCFVRLKERVELAGECRNGFDVIGLNRQVSSSSSLSSTPCQSELSTPAPLRTRADFKIRDSERLSSLLCLCLYLDLDLLVLSV